MRILVIVGLYIVMNTKLRLFKENMNEELHSVEYILPA